MTESNKVFITAILIMGIVVFLTTAGSFFFLYQTAVKEQKERLLEVVKNQAKFIDVFHEMNSEHGKDMKLETHMSHANELENFFLHLSVSPSQVGQSDAKSPILNFYIAERKGENVHYHIGSQKLLSKPVPFKKVIGKPMGMALSGETNVLKMKDHLGNPILCSFTFVPSTGMGIVAKIYLKDLRNPFIKTAFITYASAFALFIVGGLIIKMTVSPLVSRLEKQQHELKNMNKHLHKLATTDTLTELHNRQHFNEQLTFGISLTNRHNYNLSLIILDVDHFKKINDTMGHLAGDTVLKELSILLKKQIRKSDVLARWGGEEFAILLIEADKDATCSIAKKLCEMISQYDFSINRKVTCSFGVTAYVPGESATDFIHRADEGLYLAKQKGRNQVILK